MTYMRTIEIILMCLSIFFGLCGIGAKTDSLGWRCTFISGLFLMAMLMIG